MEDSTFYYPVLWLIVAAVGACILVATNSIYQFRLRIAADPAASPQTLRQLGGLKRLRRLLEVLTAVLALGGIGAWYVDTSAAKKNLEARRQQLIPVFDENRIWEAPDRYLAETDPAAKRIAYGRDLVVHTQDYFGPEGLVRPATINGLNCQSCHLDAGSKPYGNNYFAVAGTYPKMRARSGTLETIPKRVNDCFERSLNGMAIDSGSLEMQAILAYIRWLATGVPKGKTPKGAGLPELPFLTRAADPARGETVFAAKCASCHGADGQGLPMPGSARRYPPLWGPKSFNAAAGLFRLSRFAGYVKANMPFGASYRNPQLSDAEAWDVAAFVNSQPRPPHPFLDEDWPDISKKPFDHPFGPFADSFPDTQHKYGPFGPVVAFYKSNK